MIPCNVWLIDSAEMALSYSLQNGRVVMITEDDDPRLKYLPNKVVATILLPPYDVIEAELDGNLEVAQMKYYQYLSSNLPAEFINMILVAAIQNVNIGLYFGQQLYDLKFPMMFMNYLYNCKGLSIGYKESVPGLIEQYMPPMLVELYGMELITLEQFLMYMPVGFDIPGFILPDLVRKFRPVCPDQDYNKYFKDLIKEMKDAGKYLYCPIVAPEVR